MKYCILIGAFFLIPRFSFCLTDFRKGYVITDEGDTLSGFVDYRVGTMAHWSCQFRVEGSLALITYSPGEIFGYGITGDVFFESKKVEINGQPERHAFMEVIVKGPVSLYKLEKKYWVQKGNEAIYQLSNEKTQTIIEGKSAIMYSNRYIGYLNMLLYDCPELRDEINEVKLRERALSMLIEAYNECKGVESIVFEADKPWAKVVPGIIVGISSSELHFGQRSPAHLSGNFKTVGSPFVGISLDVLSPRITERMAFHVDILYLGSKYRHYNQQEIFFSVRRNYVAVEIDQLKIPLGFRYIFRERMFTPYFNFGVSGTMHLNSRSTWVQEVEISGVVETAENEALPITRKQVGFWGGIGVLKSVNDKLNVFCEFRYEQTDGLSENSIFVASDLASTIKNFQVFLGLRLK